jgi:hypothetical protein
MKYVITESQYEKLISESPESTFKNLLSIIDELPEDEKKRADVCLKNYPEIVKFIDKVGASTIPAGLIKFALAGGTGGVLVVLGALYSGVIIVKNLTSIDYNKLMNESQQFLKCVGPKTLEAFTKTSSFYYPM